MATVAVLSSGRSWSAPAWMTVTLRGSTVRGHARQGGQAPDQASDEWARPVLADRGTCPTQGTPAGGQYSRGSPLTAGTSLSGQPGRGTSHTHSVLVGATLPRAVRVTAVDRQADVDAQLGMLGHLGALVPGQGAAQLVGQRRDRGGDRV